MAGKRKNRAWLVVVIFILAGAGSWWYWQNYRGRDNRIEYRLAEVRQGKLVAQVSASGTLNAVTTVQVGSQVSGQIKELRVDYNSPVTKGQLIALIDPVKFAARVNGSTAELKVAEASRKIKQAAVGRARAELGNSQSALKASQAQVITAQVAVTDTNRQLGRQRALLKNSAVSQSKVDDAEAAHDKALAQLSAAKAQKSAAESSVRSREAALRMAQAEVGYALSVISQREAALEADQVDLANTRITSPVDGVVIKRSVDVGQTVAASLQAPELYIIAQDLAEMQVDASIDEADIGRVRVGQEAVYTVDAFPGWEFRGRVSQIRKSPNTIQNVVTYTVVISTANPKRTLLPGMTANVKVTVAQKDQTLMVPNAALRFKPREGEAVQPQTKPGGIESKTAQGSTGILDNPGDGGSQTQPRAENNRSGGRRGAIAKRIAHLTRALDLSPDQVQVLKDMYVQLLEKAKDLRAKGLSREEIKAEAAKARRQNQAAFRAQLSPEQLAKLKKLSSAQARAETTSGRVWLVGQDGRPIAKDITLGITDGAFTSVVKGDLKKGQKIITGHKLNPKGGK